MEKTAGYHKSLHPQLVDVTTHWLERSKVFGGSGDPFTGKVKTFYRLLRDDHGEGGMGATSTQSKSASE